MAKNVEIIRLIGVCLDLTYFMRRCSSMADFDWDFDRIT